MSYAGPESRSSRAADAASNKTAGARGAIRPAVDESTDRSGSALFAAGVALGVVVGAGVALLLAPQAGTDTRRALARRSRRIGVRGHDAWDDLRIEFRRALKRRLAARRRHRADKDLDIG